jgi:hypothetical protein
MPLALTVSGVVVRSIDQSKPMEITAIVGIVPIGWANKLNDVG